MSERGLNRRLIGMLARIPAARLCDYCGIAMTKARGRGRKIRPTDRTIDHIVPRVAGGPAEAPLNRAFCCRKCNSLKGETSADQFQGFIARYGLDRYRAADEAKLRGAYAAYLRRTEKPPAKPITW